MSIYLRQDEIKPGALVKAMSHDNEIIPALIVSHPGIWNGDQRGDFVRVMDTTGEICLVNVLYLERWR
tara:strand:- start:369 stop:572 length:204 start_codon:yes stop_codon:yes gene_type:complete